MQYYTYSKSCFVHRILIAKINMSSLQNCSSQVTKTIQRSVVTVIQLYLKGWCKKRLKLRISIPYSYNYLSMKTKENNLYLTNLVIKIFWLFMKWHCVINPLCPLKLLKRNTKKTLVNSMICKLLKIQTNHLKFCTVTCYSS